MGKSASKLGQSEHFSDSVSNVTVAATFVDVTV